MIRKSTIAPARLRAPRTERQQAVRPIEYPTVDFREFERWNEASLKRAAVELEATEVPVVRQDHWLEQENGFRWKVPIELKLRQPGQYQVTLLPHNWSREAQTLSVLWLPRPTPHNLAAESVGDGLRRVYRDLRNFTRVGVQVAQSAWAHDAQHVAPIQLREFEARAETEDPATGRAMRAILALYKRQPLDSVLAATNEDAALAIQLASHFKMALWSPSYHPNSAQKFHGHELGVWKRDIDAHNNAIGPRTESANTPDLFVDSPGTPISAGEGRPKPEATITAEHLRSEAAPLMFELGKLKLNVQSGESSATDAGHQAQVVVDQFLERALAAETTAEKKDRVRLLHQEALSVFRAWIQAQEVR